MPSTLHKLRINGFRSFSPDPEDHKFNTIVFQQPVTLVVGPNGCGKTTIIECLKYITTGEMPSMTKQGFVHDPRLVTGGQAGVEARLRMSFTDCFGEHVKVFRSVKAATTKSGNVSQKTLANTLMINDKTIDSKCSDINAQMEIHLGVDKAVLSNVIFCHQEDSNWPLGKDADVKDRFDAIFSATKYINALKSIKTYQKDMLGTCKVLDEQVKHLKEKCGQVTDITAKRDELIASAVETEARIARINGELEPIKAQLDELSRVSERRGEAQIELQTVEKMRIFTAKENKDLKKRLNPEYKDSEAELRNRKDELEFTHAPKLAELDRRVSDLVQEEESRQKEMSDCRTKMGSLSRDEEQNARKVHERNDFIKDMRRKHGIVIAGGDVVAFKAALDTKRADAQQAVEASEAEFRAADEALGKEQDELTSKKTMAEATIDGAQENLERTRLEIDSAREKLANLPLPDISIETACGHKEAAEAKVREIRETGAVDTLRDEVYQHERTRSDLQDKHRIKKNIHDRLMEHLRSRTELQVKRSTLKGKKEEQAHLLRTHDEELNDIFDGDVPIDANIMQRCKAMNDERKVRAANTSRALEDRKRELREWEIKVTECRAHIDELQRNLVDKQKRLEAVVGKGKDFEAELEAKKKAAKDAASELDSATNLSKIYKTFLASAKSKHCCPLCSRDFAQAAAFEAFLATLSGQSEGIPARVVAKKKAHTDAEQAVEQMQGLRIVRSEVEQLRNKDVPEARAKLSEATSKVEDVSKSIEGPEGLASASKEAAAQLAKVDRLRSPCDKLGRLAGEISGLTNAIERSERLLPQVDQNMTIESVGDAIEELENGVKDATSRIDLAKEKIVAQERELTRLQLVVTEAEKHVLEVQRDHEAIQRERTTVQRLEDEKSRIEAELATQSSVVEPLKASLQTVIANRERAQKEHAQTMRGLQALVKDLDSDVASAESLNKLIADYERQDVPRRLEEVRTRLQVLDEAAVANKTERRQLGEQRADLVREQENVDATKANIEDNLRYRQQCAEVARYKKEEARLHAELAELGGEGAGYDQETLEANRDDLMTNCASDRGELMQLQRRIEDYEVQLAQSIFKDVDKEYRQKFLEHRTTLMARDDLQTYCSALDEAINKFHQEKMKEINLTLRELWTEIYRGDDIDYIKISCEASSGTAATARKRSYNYRLVMAKGKHMMDMRGRCSAGQKVLAGILVRIALAETFCVHCGILTLDEPTTNLDRENIDSLATSLSRLIERRRSQNGFQLIIITHDEDFVKALGRSNVAEEYYRVSKDKSGYSRIKVQDMRRLEV
eukprot:UC1_evm1s1687